MKGKGKDRGGWGGVAASEREGRRKGKSEVSLQC